MTESFDTAFKLLGRCLDSPEYHSFSQLFGKPQQEINIPYSLRVYLFPAFGLDMRYSLSHDCFCGISVSFFTKSILQRSRNPFDGAVYAGILASDSPKSVRMKLGREPYYRSSAKLKPEVVGGAIISSSDTREDYLLDLDGLPPCTLSVIFESFSGRLSLVSMSIEDWTGP